MQKSWSPGIVTTIANLAAALAIVVPVAACDSEHFSGELGVSIDSAEGDTIVLALVPNSAGGLNDGATAVDVDEGGACVAKNIEESSEVAFEPLQVFAVEAGEFTIRFDDALPPGPLSLVAFVDANDDGALDVAADADGAITTERCIGATKTTDDSTRTLVEISVYDDGELSGDRFGPVAQDGAGVDQIYDADATGWRFDLQ
jgi:hypothetical protein